MDKNIPIYLDGLERSGNMYLANVVRKSFEHDVISLRTHDLSTLMNYKESNPFIVPVRDAFESIASAKVYRNHTYSNNLFGDSQIHNSSITTIISRYNDYFDYLIKSPQFFIAPFHIFIKDHDQVIDKIIKFHEDRLELKISKRYTIEEIFTDINGENAVESYGKHAYSLDLGNFPREKAKERDQVESTLLKKYKDDIKVIQDKVDILYQRYYDIG
jgi:hypothetical protein